MTTDETLTAANADLRAAVEARLAATTETPAPEPAIPVDWILRGEAELKARREAAVTGWKQVVADAEPARQAVRDGTTAKFGTGAVRSDTFEGVRYDLVSPIGLREVARACAEGAAKYDDFNWERGMPVHDLLNHALAHIYGFLAGDRSEPHLGHAAWNLLAAIHSHELWPELNDGHLRQAGCKRPVQQERRRAE